MHDLKTSLRSLLRRPLFSLVVVVTLGLGIGASTAILSVADAVLLRALPYDRPSELVDVFSTVERDGLERRAFSFPDYVDLEQQATTLGPSAVYRGGFAILTLGERSERVPSALVSADYFRALGVAPRLGRAIAPAEDGGRDEVVLSSSLHQSLFGNDPATVGARLIVDGEPRTIVGIMPAGFLDLSGEVDLWESMALVSGRAREDRGGRFLSVVARLRDGSSLEGARNEVATIFERLESEYPDSNSRYGAGLEPLREVFFGDLRLPALMLLGAVSLVLLIACVNVANLLLVRASGRSRELALRSALGAGRLDSFRHIGTETAILAIVGGAIGMLLARVGLRYLLVLAPVGLIDSVPVELNARVLGSSLLLVLGTAAALAMSTFVLSQRRDPFAGLREDASAPGRQRARRSLLISEVSLAAVLTILAGLLVVSWTELRRVELGFQGERLAFLRLALPSPEEVQGVEGEAAEEAQEEARAQFRRSLRVQISEAAAAVPGVSEVALASDTPLAGGYSATVVSLEGASRDDDHPYSGGVRVYRHLVSPGYFSALGADLLRGRDFAESDRDDAPAVAIVSAAMASRHWPDREAIGQRFKLGRPPAEEDALDGIEWVEVVGVVENVRFRSVVPDPVGLPDDPDVYFPLEMFDVGNLALVAATQIDPASVLPVLAQRIEALAARMPVYGAETIGQRLRAQRSTQRFQAALVGAFAVAALLLAAIGIYGVMSFVVGERTKELGIRMALGASRRRITREILVEGMGMVILGLAIGGAAAWAASRAVASLLFEVQLQDQRVLGATVLLLFLVGLIGCALPARRASRVEPAIAFRSD